MRAILELGRLEILRLRNYCRRHGTFWCVAKDDGAYVCAPRGPVYYFAGCDPSRDACWRKNTRKLFHGDYEGDTLPRDWLEHVAEDENIVKMRIIVTKAHVAAEFERA